MNNIQIFNNAEFGEIRTTIINGEPWFVGRDVAIALGYSKPENALSAHIEQEDKTITLIQGSGSNYKSNTTLINESGVYSLIFASKLPKAKEFKHWVTSEILPSIRKTGSYSVNVPKTFAEALRLAADQQEQLEKQQKLIEEQKPKVEFFDTVAGSKTAIEMKEVANVLNFDKLGRNKLFQILRDNGILTRKNQPYQKFIDCGYFRTIEQEWQDSYGETNISIKTLVYQSGVDYIRKLLIKIGYKLNKKENNKENELQDNNAR